MQIEVVHLGLLKYSEALAIMEFEHKQIAENQNLPEKLLVVSHPPVVTMGNRELTGDLKFTPEWLAERGIDYVKIDRGGSVTVHEPGQVVLYPLVRLDSRTRTVRSFVNALEESMIECCKEFGIVAARDPINPGVWVNGNKVGALGIRVLNHVAKHGLAFNVNNSLETFSTIVPCGIRGRGVTSLALEVERTLQNPTTKLYGSDFFDKVELALVKSTLHFLSQNVSKSTLKKLSFPFVSRNSRVFSLCR